MLGTGEVHTIVKERFEVVNDMRERWRDSGDVLLLFYTDPGFSHVGLCTCFEGIDGGLEEQITDQRSGTPSNVRRILLASLA